MRLLLLLLQLDMVIRVLNNVFSPVALRQLYAYADANRSRSKKNYAYAQFHQFRRRFYRRNRLLIVDLFLLKIMTEMRASSVTHIVMSLSYILTD